MYLFLTDHNSEVSPFAPTHTTEEPLTTALISDKFHLNTWEAEKKHNCKADGTPVPDSFYIHKLSKTTENRDPKILNPYVKGSYEIIQYPQALTWLDYFVAEQLVYLDSALYIDDVTMAVNLRGDPTEFSKDIIEGDTVNTYLVLSLGHGPYSRRMLGFTTVRAVCSNTLAMGQVQSLRDLNKHFTLTGPGSLQKAKEAINFTAESFTHQVGQYEHWSTARISAFDRELVFEAAVGMQANNEPTKMQRRNLDALERAYTQSPGMEMFGTDSTAWRIYNAVTYVAGHLGSDDVKRYQNSHAIGATMRRRTHKILAELT